MLMEKQSISGRKVTESSQEHRPGIVIAHVRPKSKARTMNQHRIIGRVNCGRAKVTNQFPTNHFSGNTIYHKRRVNISQTKRFFKALEVRFESDTRPNFKQQQ